jgi:outer membrane protein assembly factor BamE (lipoprotein component of BamABCDE complex)
MDGEAQRIARMIKRGGQGLGALLLSVIIGGCGVVYDTSAHLRTSRIAHSLKVGESKLQVHDKWGEPDLRTQEAGDSEVWSYVSTPNSNDAAAMLLYTSTKPGDSGKFLDLKFVDGKLVSWGTAEHTMPAKKGAGFSYGLGPTGGASPITHY